VPFKLIGLTVARLRGSFVVFFCSLTCARQVSEDVAGLTKLRSLQLGHNRLSAFPDDWFTSRTCLMEELTDLRTLDLSFNR
jgi:Leucine-rich repeat (LRR) protein